MSCALGQSFAVNCISQFANQMSEERDDNAVKEHLLRALALEEEVGEVGRQDAEYVQLEPAALPVVLPQHGRLLHHDALVKVALVHPDQQIKQVDCVADIVDHQPTLRTSTLVNLGRGCQGEIQ